MSLDKTRGLSYDLAKILSGIAGGRVALPDFQRDFDWTTNDVRALLATVVSGWPIGSLLLMADPPVKLFNLRAIEQAPPLSAEIDTVVLDGQQRLTALYHALYGRGSTRYGLQINLIDAEQSIDSVDEAVVAFPRSEWDKKYASSGDQLRAYIVPMTALRDAATFFEWRDEAKAAFPLYDGPDLTSLYRNLLSGLHGYDVPAVVIDPDVPPAGIARIFERVNRMGLPLGTFDLMVAKSFSPGFNLRDEWANTRRDYPRLDAFLGDDGLSVLSVIALRNNEDVRQRAVLDMPGSAVRDGWGAAVIAMNHAIGFISSRLGVWNPDWIPYKNVLTIIAALSYDNDLSNYARDAEVWFWKTALERRYDVASNTRAVSDYRELLATEEVSTWDKAPVTLVREDMIECNRKQFGTLHRAFICLLARLGPADVVTAESLTASSLDDGLVPDVVLASLFPTGYPAGEAGPAHLRTLGMVLVKRASSRKVAGLSFDDLHDGPATAQLVPDPTADDIPVDRFAAIRLSLVVNAISEITGRSVRVLGRDA